MADHIDPHLTDLLELDKQRLESSQLPIITVSGTFTEDLKRLSGLPFNETDHDVVYSRAHFSMALAIATEAWGHSIDPQMAWMVDPTNHVDSKDWLKIQLTETIGKTLARHSFLKKLKDIVDQFGRNKLPILKAIEPSLLHLTSDLTQPILSLHIAVGNIIAPTGRQVVQVVTDPHVRYDYLNYAQLPTMTFCVFDQKTKTEFLEKAALADKKVDPDRVIVTGPPIDRRIIAAGIAKRTWQPTHPLRLCITTGGLGTNKAEIEQLLTQLLPQLQHRASAYQLVVYAGTQSDIANMVKNLAEQHHVALGDLADTKAHLRLIYHPQIMDANEALITYGFPWADGFISKPSGDMAYDAVGSGAFLLTLQEWGDWELNVRAVFEQLEVSRPAQVSHILAQLQALTDTTHQDSWVASAMKKTQQLDSPFLEGAQRIISTVRNVKKLI